MKDKQLFQRTTKAIAIVKIIAIILLSALIVALVHVVSMVTFDRVIEFRAIDFRSPKIPKEMDGYKIAFIADTHQMTPAEHEQVVSKLNNRQLDLLVLGGDYSYGYSKLKQEMSIMSKVSAADGIFGVEGNHDNYKELIDVMARNSIHMLSNSGIRVRDNFYIAGVEDLWNRDPSIEEAVEGAGPADFVLLVSHNPDVSMRQDTTSVDLILSGHTHGGHVTFFGIFAPALARRNITDYGQRFKSGWAKSLDGVPVYVSNGTGWFASMPRVFARPQVILFTLRAPSIK